MASTRTSGIRVNKSDELIIDKEHCGTPIYVRLGGTSQEEAERRLAQEIRRIDELLACRAAHRTTFDDCAARFLKESTRNEPQH